MMLASARKLAGMGADFVICPDNTLHQALPYVLPRSPLPWLHIAEVVMAEAAARGYRRVGLTGTRWLMEGPVYPAALAPDAAEREEMNRVIMDELVRGVFKPEAVAFFQGVFRRMKDAGCDAVVMGCTEIPLIMSDANSPLPTLDSTRLLARARPCARPWARQRARARRSGYRPSSPGRRRAAPIFRPAFVEGGGGKFGGAEDRWGGGAPAQGSSSSRCPTPCCGPRNGAATNILRSAPSPPPMSSSAIVPTTSPALAATQKLPFPSGSSPECPAGRAGRAASPARRTRPAGSAGSGR